MHDDETAVVPQRPDNSLGGLSPEKQGHRVDAGHSHQPGPLNQSDNPISHPGTSHPGTSHPGTSQPGTYPTDASSQHSGPHSTLASASHPEYDPPHVSTQGTGLNDINHEGLLTEDAFHALQLRAQPFESLTAGGELYADKQTFAQINEIRQALISGDTLLLLSGATGSGKSTLLKQLTAQTGQRLQFFSVRGSEQFSTRNLFAGILDSWKLDASGDLENVVKELLLSLQAAQERDYIVVIMVDDADAINTRELQLLLASTQYINSGDAPLLRIIFAAPPEFEALIPEVLPAGSNLPYASLQIEPFHASRAGPYMEFRLNQAGHFEAFPFDERQVNEIANDAAGIPARINTLAADSLNAVYAPIPVATRKSSALPGFKKVARVALGIFALGLIVAGLLYKGPEPETPGKYKVVESEPVDTRSRNTASTSTADSASQPAVVIADTKAPLTTSEVNTSDVDAAGTEADNKALNNTTESADTQNTNQNTDQSAGQNTLDGKPAVAADTPSTETKAATTTAGNTAATENAAVTPAAEGKAADSKSTDTEQSAAETNDAKAGSPQTVESSGTDQSAATEQANAEQAPTEQTQAEQTQAEQSQTDQPKAEVEQSNVEQPAAEQPKTDQPAATKPEPQADNVEGLESANWILVQNPNLYTVQMSATTDRKSVVSFLRRSDLEAPNSIFSFQRNGKTWFALVHGLYPTIKDAREAIEQMTKAARSNQPWIREVGRIQKALKSTD